MGSSKSKESQSEIENSGQISNTIVVSDVRDVVDVHSSNDFIIQCLILSVLVIELVLYMYYKFRKNIKKQYLSRRDINLSNV